MNIESIYNTAQQFENTANYLAQQIPLSMPKPPVIPFAVNVTFSVEMYLKCLILIETKEPPKKIHELHDLYKSLSNDSQTSIRMEFEKLTQNSPFQNTKGTPFATMKIDIDSVLQRMNRTFVGWRYAPLEKPKEGSGVSNTAELITAIKKRINELHQF